MSRIGSRPNRAGMRSSTTRTILATPSSGSRQRRNGNRCRFGSRAQSGIRPWLMRWALAMIWLSAAWRKISVSRTTGTAPEPMMSASTWPGPTDGSWSTSPTRISAASSGTARRSACISGTSTIDVSSTTSRSHVSGFSSLPRKLPVLGSTSSSRWMVFASRPVLSLSRLAARPVGAARAISTPVDASTLRIELIRVVLPTPGPPVITRTLESKASRQRGTSGFRRA